MKVRVSDSIVNLRERIVETYSESEMRAYNTLSFNEKEEILSETFERRFKVFWNSVTTVFKKEVEQEEESEKIDNQLEVRPKKNEEDVVALLGFDFNKRDNIFEVKIENVSSSSKNDYRDQIERDLLETKKYLENNYTNRMFLGDFFATLHAHRLSVVTAHEATMMYDIYPRVIKHYPAFKRLPYSYQMDFMRKAYLHGRVRVNTAHDIYGFAKATFEMLDKEGLINELVYGRLMEQVYERRITRRHPEIRSEIWQRNYLVYVTYEYMATTGDRIRESYHPSDLWLILAQL